MRDSRVPSGYLCYASARSFGLLPGLPKVEETTNTLDEFNALSEKERAAWEGFEIDTHMTGMMGLRLWRQKRNAALAAKGMTPPLDGNPFPSIGLSTAELLQVTLTAEELGENPAPTVKVSGDVPSGRLDIEITSRRAPGEPC